MQLWITSLEGWEVTPPRTEGQRAPDFLTYCPRHSLPPSSPSFLFGATWLISSSQATTQAASPRLQLFKLWLELQEEPWGPFGGHSRAPPRGRVRENWGGSPFLSVMTSRVVCLALNYPQLGRRKAWGGRIAKQSVRDGVTVKYLAGRNSHHSLNPCRCHCECLSRLGGSFDPFVDPMHNLMTFFWKVACWVEGLWKWISCLYKYCFCIIQSFLSEKELKSSVWGFSALLICWSI